MTIPSTTGLGEGSDRELKEMAQKNAALWIQYATLSIGRSNGTELLDNGGLATVPAREADASLNNAEQRYGKGNGEVVS